MKNMDTKFMSRFADMVRLVEHQQKAIEELVEKSILLAQNLNTQQFRLMVTERLVKEKLGITPDDIMTAGLEAIEDDKRQRADDLEKEAAKQKATEEHPHTGSAAMPESLRSELAAGAAVPVPHRLQSIPRTLQTPPPA